MHRNSASVSTKQERIATLAKQSPEMAFTSLAYLLDIEWLNEAYQRTRKDGAVGVDGVTAEEYEQDLEGIRAAEVPDSGRLKVSPHRNSLVSREAISHNKASPTSCPKASLMCLKRSKSRNIRANCPRERRVRAKACCTRSSRSDRFGKPVSLSYIAARANSI